MSDYIDGQLAPSQCAEVEAFLADDVEAAKIMDELIAIQSGLKSFKNEEKELGPEFTQQVLSTIANDSSSAVNDVVELASMPASRKITPIWAGLSVLAASLFLVFTWWPTDPAINNTDGQFLGNQIDPHTSNSEGPLNGSDLVDGSDTNQEQVAPVVVPRVVDPGMVVPDNQNPVVVVEPDKSGTPDKPNIPNQPDKNAVVGPTNKPSLKGIENMVGMESLLMGKLLFVIEIGVTPEGVENEVVKDILMKNGIVYDDGLEVLPALEAQLLGTRYLDGVIKKPMEGQELSEVAGQVDLIYMVCTGMQVDQTRLDIHSRHKDIAKYRFNLAMLPKDMKTFDLLHDAVNAQWATTPAGKSNQTAKAAYQERLK
ncbi:MAG: anti-sigma factor family protein, partial [Pirellulales bacterium]